MKLFAPILFLYLFISTITSAQTPQQTILDPYGFVNKYDTSFNGIGPEVYILPLPKSLAEEMQDSYQELLVFQDSIRIGFQYERLLSTFKPTSNQQTIQIVLPDTISDQDYNKILQQFINQKNHPAVYALYNSIAKNQLLQYQRKDAIASLHLALQYAQSANRAEDIAIIQSNLASIYLLENQFEEALKLEQAFLSNAEKTKNTAEQALSYTRIALIEAYNNNYRAAENTIIRKAFPLFNKSKFYVGKIQAWVILAEIYRSQNKHTEAQWFLLQARDLANEKKLKNQITTIEYMLGSSKVIQGNYKVAKDELELAFQLAQETSDKYLQLAIIEQLGRSHVYLKNYESAKSYLAKYWELRKSLFSKNITSFI